jgi:glycosyltransferase involved in cell wall biosynthesis
VSYVPITEYFHFQPVTKTYEYLMAGLPVIATSTFENQKIIDEKNGILIEDNAFAFSAALSKIINLMDTYNSSFIRERMTEHKWEKIVLQLEKHLLLENRSKN